MTQKEFPCPGCGATLYFSPSDQQLVCPHCGYHGEIPLSTKPVQELDYLAQLQQLGRDAPTQETLVVQCTSCGAQTTLPPNVTAGRCPFCDNAIVAQKTSIRQIQPQWLLPFSITRQQAMDRYKQWLGSLWLAPRALKNGVHIQERLSGLYVPFWTYDSGTSSSYTGQRGDDYWVTQTYSVMVNGRSQMRTRQVRQTRWTSVAGHVNLHFDDVLVLASRALPVDYTDALEPWDLKALVPSRDEYLSGFIAQSYQVDLPEGFAMAKQKMDPAIRHKICTDIGGDHQRISSVDTQYDDITFKHLLLPIWLASYQYQRKVYRFLINARTGEVQGQRPWSAWKIGALVAAGLAVLLLALWLLIPFFSANGHS